MFDSRRRLRTGSVETKIVNGKGPRTEMLLVYLGYGEEKRGTVKSRRNRILG